MKTIAIDFDGVIHAYTKGWQDGSIYDVTIDGSIEAINDLMRSGVSVVIFSTRSSRQIIKWLKDHSNQLLYHSYSQFQDRYLPMHDMDHEFIQGEYNNNKQLQFKVKKVPFWKKFWNDNLNIGVTNRKLPCHVYVDDRAVLFAGSWEQTLKVINEFKTYQQNGKS